MTRFLSDFEALVRDDAGIDLAAAALAFAREEYPDLRPNACLARLDGIAADAAARVPRGASPLEVVEGISACLHGDMGFRGNIEAYGDPRNSFLNEVIDRRLGLPITLCTVYVEVARRMGLPIVGVGMPGHFIAKYDDGVSEVLFDPFEGGQVLRREDCQARLDALYRGTLRLQDQHLAATPHRQVLARMLRNLKGVYQAASRLDQTLWVCDYLLAVLPSDPIERRDRGLVRFRLGDWDGSVDDLVRSLQGWPAGMPGREEVEGNLADIRRSRRKMN